MIYCWIVLWIRILCLKIDYGRFVIRINLNEEELKTAHLNELLRQFIENKIWLRNAREYIRRVRQFLQYSWPFDEQNRIINPTFKYDAYGMILSIMGEYFWVFYGKFKNYSFQSYLKRSYLTHSELISFSWSLSKRFFFKTKSN